MDEKLQSVIDEVLILGYRLSRTQLLMDAIVRLHSLQEGLTHEMLDEIDRESKQIVLKMFPHIKDKPDFIVQ